MTQVGIGHNSELSQISIETRLFNSLSQYAEAGGWRQSLKLPPGSRIGDIVRLLGLPHPEIFLVMRNGRDVTPGLVGDQVSLDVEVNDGDVIAFSGPVPYSYGFGAPVV